jgi:hypothetical protein
VEKTRGWKSRAIFPPFNEDLEGDVDLHCENLKDYLDVLGEDLQRGGCAANEEDNDRTDDNDQHQHQDRIHLELLSPSFGGQSLYKFYINKILWSSQDAHF